MFNVFIIISIDDYLTCHKVKMLYQYLCWLLRAPYSLFVHYGHLNVLECSRKINESVCWEISLNELLKNISDSYSYLLKIRQYSNSPLWGSQRRTVQNDYCWLPLVIASGFQLIKDNCRADMCDKPGNYLADLIGLTPWEVLRI